MKRSRSSETDTISTMRRHRARLRFFIWGLAVAWSILVALLLTGQVLHQEDQVLEVARLQAESLLQRDLVYRQWVAMNSGIYVAASRITPPNPQLSKLPSRDIRSSDGRKLTLVNPAYMSRLVYELAAQRDSTRSHITSLKPLRPQNTPDSWEAAALQEFAQGKKESRTVAQSGGRDYFRLMAPLYTEKECLECHAEQGYRVGEVRGGISVTTPLAPLQRIAAAAKLQSRLRYGLLWLIGLAGIFLSSASLSRSLRRHEQAEQSLRYLSSHDGLTDCYNRIYFDTELRRLTKGRDFPIGVMMVDLDGLKQVNDTLGHGAGDTLIRRAADVLKQACRDADIIARLGGDEFALLLPGVDAAALTKIFGRIRDCEAAANEADPELAVAFSLGGIAAENPEALRGALKQADLLMYQDKLARKQKRPAVAPTRPAARRWPAPHALTYAGPDATGRIDLETGKAAEGSKRRLLRGFR